MRSIRKILVATDYSEEARRAEIRAAMLCTRLRAEAVELATSQKPEAATRGQDACVPAACNEADAAGKSAARERSGSSTLRWQGRADAGPRLPRMHCAPEEIIARAAEIDADLVVAAGRGRRLFADVLNVLDAFDAFNVLRRQGNDELLRLTDRPLLLVSAEPEEAYRRVLVAIDFSDESREAAHAALAIAPAAHFTFLHAFRDSGEHMQQEAGVSGDTVHSQRMRARELARLALNRFIESLGPRKQLISRSIHYGAPAAVIAAQARHLQCDLVVMGKHGTSRRAGHPSGSVTQRIAAQGRHDLLVATVPQQQDMDPLSAA
ncbi:hypothetical protein GCM10027343_09990 [Noviherbaspirillum agri]